MKVKGPLMSLEAKGLIGERLVFSKRSSGQQARFQKAQNDVSTVLRVAQRAKYILAVTAWNSLDTTTKIIFNALAVGQTLTGYNLFIKLHILGEIVGSDASIYGFRNYGIIMFGKE